MLKLRITYNRNNKDELEKAIDLIKKEYDIVNRSKEYKGRGESLYNNVYVDIELKKDKE